ncbi:hypothetical protein ACFE04_008934 [Oxalis oulophora]
MIISKASLLPLFSLLLLIFFLYIGNADDHILHREGASLEKAKFDTGGLSRKSFPDGFVFGTATSAYQVEGMADKDGRGPSIWDVYVNVPGHIAENATAEVAVDQYHRYKLLNF